MFRSARRAAVPSLCLVAALLLGGLTAQRADAANRLPAVVNAPFGEAGLTSQATINGLLGGTVTAGRMTVLIPPGAIAGVATVTVTQPDTSKMVAELHVEPEFLNHFAVPVLLTMRAGGLLSLDVLRDSRIEWFNPSTGQWVPVPGSIVSVAGLSLQAPLWHFSTYRATGGKAGW